MNTAVKMPAPVKAKAPAPKQERNYGIDLLRIVSMLMVVVLHICSQAIVPSAAPYTYAYNIAIGFESVTYCAVNVFAMITGYVCVGKKFRLSRAASVWAQGFTYFMGIFAVLAIIQGYVIPSELIAHFFPLAKSAYWYLNGYVMLVFAMPLLDRIIDGIDRKTHLITLFIISLFAEFGLVFGMTVWPFGEGYTALWLIALYLFGAYFRKYGLPEMKKRYLLLIFIGCAAVMFLSKYVMRYISLAPEHAGMLDRGFFRYTAIPCVIESVALFNLFAKFNIGGKRTAAVISFFSSASFAVYLIHTHPHILTHYIPKISFILNYRIRYLIPLVLLIAAGIYLVCTLAEHLRKLIFKYLQIDRFIGFVSDKIQAGVLHLFRKV